MAEPLLQIRAANLGYPNRVVLESVDLQVRPGEVIALIGPNGTGKSTLLKSVIAAIPALAGEIQLRGRPLSRLSPREVARHCAFIAQDDAISFDFTAKDVVMMGRMPHNSGLIESAEDRSAVDQAMRRAGCEELADRPMTQLSGGERQRVMLARAVAQDAPLLLLDEPNAHLDPGHSLAMEQLLLELAREGRGILAAIHDLNIAQRLGGQCALAFQGKIGPVSPLRELVVSGALDQAYGAPLKWHETESGPVVAVLGFSGLQAPG